MAVGDIKKQGRGYKPPAKKAKDVPSAAETSLADPVEQWADKPDSAPYQDALKLYTPINKAFENKDSQANMIEEFWNIYNATPDPNQQYSGNSQGYIPAVRDAINARSKRALKQLFPANGQHVQGMSADGKNPSTQLALLEHYIRKTHLKEIVRSDLVAGDVTGQWNLMLDWTTTERTITNLVRRNPIVKQMEGEDVSDLGLEDPTEEEEATEQEEVTEQGPDIVDFATEDLAVVPPTCNDLQKAEIVALRLRMSQTQVRRMIDQGTFVLPAQTTVEEFCDPDNSRDKHNPPKRQTKEVGVKLGGTDKHAIVYMAYTRLDFDEKDDEGERLPKQSALIFYSGQTEIVGLIKNPLWSGKVPIISKPVERIKGSFFGKSKIDPVKFLQWNLNDFHNMGQDAAMYTVLPIWAADPIKNPNWASMVMGLAAVWPIAPDDIKPITQPQLWKESAQMCDMLKRQIYESMDVNEMMMGKMPQGKKNNQLLGSLMQEQQVNITDHASRYEEEMLNPLLEMMFEFDQQFRDAEVMVQARGEIGAQAALQEVPIQQWGERYYFSWKGTDFMLGMQRLQQQIAWMNVLKGVPPQLLNGRRLDVTPILEAGTENLFGPELGPRILIDERNKYTIPPEVEDEILANGMDVEVHEADDDVRHMQSHMRAAAVNGDMLGKYRNHMMLHAAQMQKKQQMQMAAKQGQGPGAPGGPGGAGPGVAGTPRPGAQPAPGGPRPAQNPPGAIPRDQMADGMVMPRS